MRRSQRLRKTRSFHVWHFAQGSEMSIKLLSAAWDLPIGSTEKMVLMSLCDFANENGICWPSVATICLKTSKSERTVQSALKWLKDNGFYEINGYHKQTPLYELNPRKICTPAEIAPPQVSRKTPAKSAPKPSRTTIVDKAKALPTKRAIAKPDGIEQNIWNDYLELRKAKRAPLSNTALTAIQREAAKAGWSMNDTLSECVARGWQSFKADWVRERRNGQQSNSGSMGVTERAARQAMHEIAGGTGRFEDCREQIPPGDGAGNCRTIDAVPDSMRAIGYAGG
jgi:Helix-turn-helix domain